MRRKRFLGLRHGLRVGVREGETLSPGCFGSTCARGLGECFRGASGEATYGEWVGQDVRLGIKFLRRWVHMAARGANAQKFDPKTEPLSVRTTPSATLTEAADGTHKEVEMGVGVSGESGRWVSRADSRRKNRAKI